MRFIKKGTLKTCSECGNNFIPRNHLGRPYGINSKMWFKRTFCSKSCSTKFTGRGKKQSKETVEKRVSKIRGKPRWKTRGITGKRHFNWRGGYGTDRHRKMSQYEYIEWRSAVFERDLYTCQDCGVHGCYLMAHHIKSWAKYPSLRYEISNGITYCKECHAKNDKYYRKFYKKGENIK